MKGLVDIVIPVHNSVHWLAWCLEDVFKFSSDCLGKVFVVDDRSDFSESLKLKEIIRRYPKVDLISNTSIDGGFAYSCNLGAESSTSEIILFLNTDCLLTKGAIDKLLQVFNEDPKVALACPISNNSPSLTFRMLPGFSFHDMAYLFDSSTLESLDNVILEACTIVGNCLAVRKDFFKIVGGFSDEWGIGYGEETDLHMKALSMGMKGVVHTGCYVYHYGGGTFNFEQDIEKHKQNNYKLFMEKWGEEYSELAKRCEIKDPIKSIARRIKNFAEKKSIPIELDALFYLPCIDQGIGGINAVISICNDLIRSGLKVSCALVGPNAANGLSAYQEPILFNFLYYESAEEFLEDRLVLPKIVFSSIFFSAPIVSEYAKQRNAVSIQFIQGYEAFFDNGIQYFPATKSYGETKNLVTTSEWLNSKVKRHLKCDQSISQLPLIINEDIFFAGEGERQTDVCLILRASADKGQWLLIEILDHLVESNLSITVLYSHLYENLLNKYSENVNWVPLPIGQYPLAKLLRNVKVFVDCSLHEGYGLMPLEAALCGCSVVASDSGGVRDFAKYFDIDLVDSGPDPDRHVKAIQNKLSQYDSKKIKNDWVRSEESWLNFIKNHSAYVSPKLIDERKYGIKDILYHAPADLKSKSNRLVKRFYRFCRPVIPNRLHLVLKVLIKGHA